MGFLKDVHKLNKMGKEMSANNDVGGRMDNAMASMQAANAMMAQQTAAANLAVAGVDAEGTITGITQTGQFINMQPVLSIELLVMPTDGRPPYPVTVSQPVDAPTLPKAIAGTTVKLKVDPAIPETVWINWMAS